MTEKKDTPQDYSKGNLSGIKVKPITSIHHYSGRLLFGDTIKILSEMKKGDAYFNSFYNDEKGVFVNEIEDLKHDQEVEYFTLPYQGGAYHHLFYLENKQKELLGFYIDTASAHFVHEQGKDEFFNSDFHANLLGDIIILAHVKKGKLHSKFISKSRSILTTECGDIVKFLSNEQPCLDHTKISVNEAKKKLTELCFNPKCKFTNFVGTDEDKNSYDFYIDDLVDFKDTNFSVFKLDFKNFSSTQGEEMHLGFAAYYLSLYEGEDNLSEKLKLSEKDKKYVDNYMKKWSSDQLGKFGLDAAKLGIDIKKDHTPIERYKDHIKDYGTTMGYYFLCNSFVKKFEKLKKQ
jgi:hypothetical protein